MLLRVISILYSVSILLILSSKPILAAPCSPVVFDCVDYYLADTDTVLLARRLTTTNVYILKPVGETAQNIYSCLEAAQPLVNGIKLRWMDDATGLVVLEVTPDHTPSSITSFIELHPRFHLGALPTLTEAEINALVENALR